MTDKEDMHRLLDSVERYVCTRKMEEGYWFFYEGFVSQDLITELVSNCDALLPELVSSLKIRKRIFHFCVEMFQNSLRHASRQEGSAWTGKVVFALDAFDGLMQIVTVNPVWNAEVDAIRRQVDAVNEMPLSAIKPRFMQQMVEGELNRNGGAGLGLMDIVRKSEHKMAYRFCTLDAATSLFLAEASIRIE